MLGDHGGGDLSVIAALTRTIREHRIALVHAHEFYMSTVGAVVAHLTHTPLVLTVHGRNYYPERRRRRVIYRMAATRAAKVVAVSRDLQQYFCRTTGVRPDQVDVIYNGVGVGRFDERSRDAGLLAPFGIPANAPILGTVGNLYPVKGQIFLIRAARAVLDRVPDLHVIILGRGELHDALNAEAAALGIQDRIHLLGYRDDASRWFGVMTVFALPSLSEGLPLSLLEAMAAGLPAVVTSVGGMPEVVQEGQTGFIVPPRDTEALSARLTVLLKDPPLANKMGLAGRRLVEARFSLNRMAEDYRDLYARTLGTLRPGQH
jgi:glycosyltransferase involved in cell wall biosynthesis